jgi:DNA-binding transcriptional ArsR family regulator
MAENKPERTTMVLDTPERLKAISHPLRLGILRVLGDRERTNEELAKELNVASGKLYFHTKKLLEVGMIELAGTRQKGPLTEKLYRATISDFVAREEDRRTAFFSAPLQAALDLYRNTWDEIGDPHGVFAAHYFAFHTPETEAKLGKLLFELVATFQETSVTADTPGSRQVSLMLLMHGLSPKSDHQPGNAQTTSQDSPTDSDSGAKPA